MTESDAAPLLRDESQTDAGLLSERAVLRIRQDIVSCRLAPESRLTEAALMARYQIGKATCRVALLRLAQEGFVRALPRQGYLVTPITLRDVEEVFALRLQLEPMAARLAVGRADPEVLRGLERACRDDDISQDIDLRIGRFMNANTAFHMTIAEYSGNTRLVKVLSGLLTEMSRLVSMGFGEQQTKPGIPHDHTALIEAIEAGDAKRAEQIAYRHVAVFRDMTMEKVMASLRDTHALAPIAPPRRILA